MSKEKEQLKKAKEQFKKAKDQVKRAEVNHFKAGKYGSDKQIAMCLTRLKNAREKLEKATEKLEAAKQEYPNLFKRTSTYIKESPVKQIFSLTGLAIAIVATTVAGAVIYDLKNGDVDDTEVTDTV